MDARGGGGGRDLDWDGCWNVRDIGGLPLIGGGVLPTGRLVRGDSPDLLSAAGWQALWDFGVRTIIDLRREGECATDVVRPAGLELHRVSWDDYPDPEWNERHVVPGLPASMSAFLRDYPAAVADTARLLIRAAPAAVLVHCAGGRDRTGLFAIVIGALVGVDRQALYDDYRHSFERLLPLHRKRGEQYEIDFLESDAYAEPRARASAQVRAVIDELDAAAAERVLLAGGLGGDEVAALRKLLVG